MRALPSPRPPRPAAGASGPRPAGPLPPDGRPSADELRTIALDLARAAARLVVVADELVTAPPTERAAARERLNRCQRLLELGARRLSHTAS